MKLKKLLAAVTAAALAVTTMAVTSFTASAAEGEWSLVDGTANGIVKYEITPGDGGAVDEAKKNINVDLTSVIADNKPADKEFRCINVSRDVGMAAIDGNEITGDGLSITAKSFQLQYWWSSEKITVTFEIEYGTPIVPIEKPSTLTKSGNVYTEKITDKAKPDSADNSWLDKAASHEIDLTELVPEGFDFADLREINVAITHKSGSNGELVINKNATGEVKKIFGQTWDAVANEAVQNPTAKFELASGLTAENAKLAVDTHWAIVGDEITFTVTLKDKDGNVYPSTGGSTPVEPENPGDDTPDTPSTGKTHEGSATLVANEEYPGWYEVSISKSDLLGDLDSTKTTIVFTGADLTKVGYNSISADDYKGVDCTGTYTLDASDLKVDESYFLHVGGNAATAVTWVATESGSGSGEVVNPPVVDPTPVDPTPSTPTPSAPTTSTPTVSNNPAPVSQTTIVDTILATPDSGKSTVNLGSSTKVDKLAIEAIATKGDITIKLNVAGGAYWEINGKNVTDAKDVNLGVKVNSKLIPESKVEAFAGEKTTIQLSLSHNGDLGFTGTLNVPVGSSNNGKFANLYYYHGGKFDFVGSSPISGGRTQFAFSHASNYLIVIDDYAYGEDVSSAAGMTETTAETTNNVPYVAVLVVIAAFGASAIVLKKRLSK